MAYTIGAVAKQFSLTVSTLRYYDKEGLFPELERTSGIRQFTDRDIDALRMIECLKKSGLEIKEIRQFMQWCTQGRETYRQRHELLCERQRKVVRELKQLRQVQDMLTFKCWYYEQLLSGESADELKDPDNGKMPESIREAYISAFA